MGILADELEQLAGNEQMLEVGRCAIEQVLVEFRNNRISLLGRGNGLVIREKDGAGSAIIRLGPEDALRIGLRAIAAALKPAEGEEL